MSSCYRSVCQQRRHQNVPPALNLHQLSLTASGRLDGSSSLLHQFEARLASSWQVAQFIKWYAVLINVVEACFAIHEMTKRKRTTGSEDEASGKSSLWSVYRNMHLVTEVVMLHCNLLAIYGLLKPNGAFLLPYIILHILTLLLELNYFITRTTLGWTSWHRQQDINTASSATSSGGEPAALKPASLSMLAFVAFNLLIMIGAKFAVTLEASAVS